MANSLSFNIEFNGGWAQMLSLLDPVRFRRFVIQEMRRATVVNCMHLRKEIRERIRSKKYIRNATLTMILKNRRDGVSLVARGDLFRAITYKRVSDEAYLVGILRSAKSRKGKELVDLALILHEGKSITITRKMRAMFDFLSAYSLGKPHPYNKRIDKSNVTPLTRAELTGRAAELADSMRPRAKVYPLSGKKTRIVIPPRPFITTPFNDPRVRAKIIANWQEGMRKTITRMNKP